jgi:cell division protease FtsH
MTKALLEWETIDADQINDIMAGLPPRPPKPTQSTKAPEPPKDATPTATVTDQPAEGI